MDKFFENYNQKMISDFLNQVQVELKPISCHKTLNSAYQNANSHLTKLLLLDFFTEFLGTF